MGRLWECEANIRWELSTRSKAWDPNSQISPVQGAYTCGKDLIKFSKSCDSFENECRHLPCKVPHFLRVLPSLRVPGGTWILKTALFEVLNWVKGYVEFWNSCDLFEKDRRLETGIMCEPNSQNSPIWGPYPPGAKNRSNLKQPWFIWDVCR